MKDRFKEVRKALNLTQEEFAANLGLSRGAIINIEHGLVEAKPLFVSLVCRTYDVNEEWLRTGEGEMFVPKDMDDELAEFMGSVLREDIRESVRKQLIDLLAHLPPEAWTAIAAVMKERAAKYREDDAGNKKED